jgi:hypothetical protein
MKTDYRGDDLHDIRRLIRQLRDFASFFIALWRFRFAF